MFNKLSRFFRSYLLPAAALVLVLVLWEVAYHVFKIPKFIIPAPSGIIVETWEWRFRLVDHTWITLYETLGGFGLSVAVGVPLAILIVYSPFLRNAIFPLLVVAQSVPKVAIAPVLLLIIGHGVGSKIIVAFLVAFFPVIVDTATGLASTPAELLDLSRLYRASPLKTFMKVRFPMALPFFFSGLKVAITLAVIGAVVGEFVGSDKGLGYIIISATSYWKANLAFGSMILLALMAIILFGLVSLVERFVCPWFTSEQQR